MNIIYIDITQFFLNKSKSGIQRVLVNLIANLDFELNQIKFIVFNNQRFKLLDEVRVKALCIDFWDSDNYQDDILDIVALGVELKNEEIGKGVYFLPEVSYVPNHLKTSLDFFRKNIKVALVYDLFPMTNPIFFSDNGFELNSPYFRHLVNFEKLIFISQFSLREFDSLFKIQSLEKSVIHPQKIASFEELELPLLHKRKKTLIVVGTLEPRKSHLHIFNLVLRLNDRSPNKYDLLFIGSKGWAPHWLIDYFYECRNKYEWFDWKESASDVELSTLYRTSTAIMAFGKEGFGLPAIEAMAHGCPVVFSGEIPSATEYFSPLAFEIQDAPIEIQVIELERILVNFDDRKAIKVKITDFSHFSFEIQKAIQLKAFNKSTS